MSDQNAHHEAAEDAVDDKNSSGKAPSKLSVLAGSKTISELGFTIWIVVDLLRDPMISIKVIIGLWVAATLALFDIAHTIESRVWPKKKPVYLIFLVLAISMLAAAIYSRKEEPEPTFKLFATVQNTVLELTNTSGPAPPESDKIPTLVIPTRIEGEPAPMVLTLANDSDVFAADVDLVFTYDNNLLQAQAPHWEPAISTDYRGMPVADPRRNLASRHISITPRNGDILSPIILRGRSQIRSALCRVQVSPRDRHDTFWSFFIALPAGTNISKPTILWGTNGVIAIPLAP